MEHWLRGGRQLYEGGAAASTSTPMTTPSTTASASRPKAAALLAAIANPERSFDAIVVGEYERAFFGDQLIQMTPGLQRHRVPSAA